MLRSSGGVFTRCWFDGESNILLQVAASPESLYVPGSRRAAWLQQDVTTDRRVHQLLTGLPPAAEPAVKLLEVRRETTGHWILTFAFD